MATKSKKANKSPKNRIASIPAETAVPDITKVVVEPTTPEVPETEVQTILPEDGQNLRCCMLVYDIPSDADIYNPSWELRKIGFRANLSCWVIPEDSIPYTLIHELRTEGHADVDVVKYDMSEGPRLFRMAVNRMSKEIADQIKRTRENLKKAEDKHLNDESNDTAERDNDQTKYETGVKNTIARLEQTLKDLSEAAKLFGIAPDRIGVSEAYTYHETFSAQVAARAKAYHDATVALREAAKSGTTEGNTAGQLAAAAATDSVPHYAMADALRDTGNEAAADALTEAFEPKVEEFSLADVGTDE